MQEYLISLGVGAGISLGLALFARFCPKQKLSTWAIALANKIMNIVEVFLTKKLGKENADKIEEGILYTIAYTLLSFFDCICERLQDKADTLK